MSNIEKAIIALFLYIGIAFLYKHMDFSFIKSNRFWVLVLGSALVAAQGGFTIESIIKALEVFCTGFIAVRSWDRASEKLSEVK